MSSNPDIWFAFARTFSMLFVVLALLLAAVYLIRRLSMAKGVKGSAQLIRVLAVHHISPKEKLMLVNVMDETILIGVTPNRISRISELGKNVTMPETQDRQTFRFSNFLSRAADRKEDDHQVTDKVRSHEG